MVQSLDGKDANGSGILRRLPEILCKTRKVRCCGIHTLFWTVTACDAILHSKPDYPPIKAEFKSRHKADIPKKQQGRVSNKCRASQSENWCTQLSKKGRLQLGELLVHGGND